MSGVNKAILLGRLGKDPESHQFSNGTNNARISLATSEVYRDRTTGERKERTDWHNVVAWGNHAKTIAAYCKKGDLLYIEGKLKNRKWEKDGITHYATDIQVDFLTLLSPKREESQQPQPAVPVVQQPQNEVEYVVPEVVGEEEEDLPF